MNARKIWFATWAAASLVVATCWPGCSCGSDPDAAPPVPHTHDAPPAAAPAAPPLDLDADDVGSDAPAPDDIIGTSWRAGDLQFSLEPNGVVRLRDDRPDAPERAPGSWKLTGAQLTIRVDDYEYVFEAQGPTIRYGGKPLQRLLP